MKNSLLSTIKIVILGVLLAGGISYASTWVAPTQAPTGGNPDAPVNIGATGQIKLGGLTLGAGTGVAQGLTVLNGKVGFGISSIPSNLLFDTNGKIGATAYCDVNGQNCATPTAGWGSSTTTNNGGTGGNGGNGGNASDPLAAIKAQYGYSGWPTYIVCLDTANEPQVFDLRVMDMGTKNQKVAAYYSWSQYMEYSKATGVWTYMNDGTQYGEYGGSPAALARSSGYNCPATLARDGRVAQGV